MRPECPGGGRTRRAAPKPPANLSLNRQFEVVALYKEGILMREIAARFNIHRIVAGVICDHHGVELQSETRGLTDEHRRVAIRRYEESAPLATAGTKPGLNAMTLLNLLLAACVRMRRPAGERPGDSPRS